MKFNFERTGLMTLVTLGLALGSASAQTGTPINGTNPFTIGDLVVSQINTGGSAAINGFSVSLDEFMTTGTNQSPVGQLTLPTAASNGNNAFFVTSHGGEGMLTLSGDNKYLTIGGYSSSGAGTTPTDPSAATGTSVPRVVATINYYGTIDTSTLLKTAYSGNNIRTVYSPDGASGTSLYTGGAGGATNGGIWLTQDGNTAGKSHVQGGTGNQSAVRDIRQVGTNLYFTSTTTPGVYKTPISATSAMAPTLVASGTQTISGTTTKIADTAPDGLFVDGSGNLWVADTGNTGTGGLYEYSSTGVYKNFIQYSTANGLVGLTGDSTDLFATAPAYTVASVTTPSALVDYNIASGKFTTLASASNGNEFEGVDMAPAPEPSEYATMSMVLLGLGALAYRARKCAAAAH